MIFEILAQPKNCVEFPSFRVNTAVATIDQSLEILNDVPATQPHQVLCFFLQRLSVVLNILTIVAKRMAA